MYKNSDYVKILSNTAEYPLQFGWQRDSINSEFEAFQGREQRNSQKVVLSSLGLVPSGKTVI